MQQLKNHIFNYKDIEYKILNVISERYTNFGLVYKVFVTNTTTGLGGRYIDVDANGQPFHYSPD